MWVNGHVPEGPLQSTGVSTARAVAKFPFLGFCPMKAKGSVLRCSEIFSSCHQLSVVWRQLLPSIQIIDVDNESTLKITSFQPVVTVLSSVLSMSYPSVSSHISCLSIIDLKRLGIDHHPIVLAGLLYGDKFVQHIV